MSINQLTILYMTRTDQVSMSAYGYLYSELVQYHQTRASSISELEERLASSGYGVGFKILELLSYRNKDNRRETRIMSILQFISSSVWKSLFGRAADSLEKSIEHTDEYMIFDYNPITSNFVSVNKAVSDAYISGIIGGVLEGAGFTARVSAHSVDIEEGEMKNGLIGMPSRKDKAVFLIKFSEKVLERDAKLDR